MLGTPPPPSSARRERRRTLRLLHLMVMVAAAALTLVLTPFLMTLIRRPSSGWGFREQLAYKTTLAMTLWTPILALIAVIGNRSRPRRINRSYGFSAVLAATSAILLLFVRANCSGLIGFVRGMPVFPFHPKSFYSYPAIRFAAETPQGAATAVVAVWFILALGGAGRRPSDWFDRFCFLFGLAWVLWCLFGRDLMLRIPWL